AAAAKGREAELAAKEKLLQARSEFEKASRSERNELEALERKVRDREDGVLRRGQDLQRREKEAATLEKAVAGREKQLEAREGELERLVAEERSKLEHIAGLTVQAGQEELGTRLDDSP